MTLRPATPADLRSLRQWDLDPTVRGALIAEANGHPIGFVQIIDPEREETQYWGCVDAGHRAIDIWIGDPESRSRGYGTQMMERAIERCFADPSVHTILPDPLAANTRVHRFYERLGFECVANRDFGGHQCCVYRLRRERTPAPN